MREEIFRAFILRDYQVPVIVEPVRWLSKEETFKPHIEAHQVREVVYAGPTWPSPDEVADAVDEYRVRFAREPERIVLPGLHGGTFRGVEIVAGANQR